MCKSCGLLRSDRSGRTVLTAESLVAIGKLRVKQKFEVTTAFARVPHKFFVCFVLRKFLPIPNSGLI